MPTLPGIPLPENDRWMDSKELALLFGVDNETINRWRREEILKGYPVGPKRFFYRKSDVNKLLAEKGIPEMP